MKFDLADPGEILRLVMAELELLSLHDYPSNCFSVLPDGIALSVLPLKRRITEI
jgi:hypothetical protein